MIATTLGWIATKIGGVLSTASVDELPVTNVSTDTRDIDSNDLFIALIGDNFDGHEYCLQALKKGACAIVVSKAVNTPLPTILVADTRIALGRLAAAVKAEVAPKTIGITGSSGKTTVKEMCASILNRLGKTHATKGNFNNDIGVPLTLLDLKKEHEFAVIEMGANHQNEIDYTVNLVEPDVVTIINAAPSHLEGFGSLFGVARAKSEIFAGLTTEGTSVLNVDSPFYEFWLGKQGHHKVVSFSPESTRGDFHAMNPSLNSEGCGEFELHTPDGKAALRLRVPGMHNIGNAVLAAALCSQVGASLEDIQAGLFALQALKGRLTIVQAGPSVRLLDDSYNANVASTKAAIDTLCAFKGRRVLVFGDMGELGDNAESYHREIGDYAKDTGVDALISLGQLSRETSAQMGDQGFHAASVAEAIEQIKHLFAIATEANMLPLNILIKGSRSSRMERIIQALQAETDLFGNASANRQESGSC